MRIPRDVHADKLISLLRHMGYVIIRQTGSHVRLSKHTEEIQHTITVPNHKPLKIGTLQSIVKDVCSINALNVGSFYEKL